MSNKKLSGKVAVVTGASKGIGAAIAKQLAAEGASVVVNYASSKTGADKVVAEIGSAGGKAVAVQADVAKREEIERLFAETKKSFGQLDILVNNAGIYEFSPLDGITEEHFHKQFNLNVLGLVFASQAAVKQFDSAGGSIINIGSVNADRMPFPGGSVYAMTKAAVAGLTHGLARDLGPRGITVNTVQPGPVDTDMNPATGPFAETLKGFMAIKRYGTGGEIASMVAYLATPEAAFVTGACLTIDGGFAA